MTKVFIAGVTGKQGGATARALLAAGHQVNAYVRNTSSPTAEALAKQGAALFQGDWDALPALKTAVEGCSAVFFPSMPSFTDLSAEERWAANILNAATESETVRQVVYSTVGMLAYFDKIKEIPGWDDNEFMAQYFLSKLSGEEVVKKWAAQGDGHLKYTILRPGGFMSNWLSPWATFQSPDLISEGVWHTTLQPEYPMPLIDTEDIGRLAALAIEDPEKWHGQELRIQAERPPVQEVIELLSEFSGKDLRIQIYKLEEAEKIAKTNPIVKGMLLRMKAEPTEAPDIDLGLPFNYKTFRQYLEDNRDLVKETFKNVPT